MNVKQGDLAIIVSNAIPENIGLIVIVGEFFGSHPKYDGDDWWYVEMAGSDAMTLRGHRAKSGLIQDYRLRPISGLPDTESTDEQVTKPVTIPEGVPA